MLHEGQQDFVHGAFACPRCRGYGDGSPDGLDFRCRLPGSNQPGTKHDAQCPATCRHVRQPIRHAQRRSEVRPCLRRSTSSEVREIGCTPRRQRQASESWVRLGRVTPMCRCLPESPSGGRPCVYSPRRDSHRPDSHRPLATGSTCPSETLGQMEFGTSWFPIACYPEGLVALAKYPTVTRHV